MGPRFVVGPRKNQILSYLITTSPALPVELIRQLRGLDSSLVRSVSLHAAVEFSRGLASYR